MFKDPGRQSKPLDTPPTVYDDGRTFAYAHPRGCMLYVHRTVVDRVGGFRPEFQIWGHEHVEYSRRIFNAGLTSNPFQDAHGAPVLYSMDEHWHQHPEFRRSVNTADRQAELARNEEIYQIFRHSRDKVEYRDLTDLVVTTLLTLNPDTQRRRKMPADPALLAAWAKSCRGARRVILADELPADDLAARSSAPRSETRTRTCSAGTASTPTCATTRPAGCGSPTAPTSTCSTSPGAACGQVSCSSAMSPPSSAARGCGTTTPPTATGSPRTPTGPLMNAGVIGGSHETMPAFTHAMVREITSVTEAGGKIGIGDMAAFNRVVHEWTGKVVHGPQVTTTFRADERNDHSWFKHK